MKIRTIDDLYCLINTVRRKSVKAFMTLLVEVEIDCRNDIFFNGTYATFIFTPEFIC